MVTARRGKAAKAADDATGAPVAAPAGNAIRVLKKYPNRRLYDTQTSSYITLADVKAMVLAADSPAASPPSAAIFSALPLRAVTILLCSWSSRFLCKCTI